MITLDNYKGRLIGVFGLGKAGTSTIASLIAGGAQVCAWDDRTESRDTLRENISSELLTISEPEEWDWYTMSFLVLSPGIPLTHPEPHPVVKRAHDSGCLIVGDIDLLFNNRHDSAYIGITGTNGKSTTTALIGHVLQRAGKESQTGGNLGIPALTLEPLGEEGCYVLEMSSYQLDLLHTIHFRIALLLNITPDHIDRHGSMEGYLAAKMKIFERQEPADIAVVVIDDDYTRQVYQTLIGMRLTRVIPVSVTQSLTQGVCVRDGILYNCLNSSSQTTLDLRAISTLTGKHNWQNAAAAYAVLRLYGLPHETIADGFRSFPGLAHRMQEVGVVEGVRFINDSKATNADAASNALAAYENIYWIAGGKAKEGGIESLSTYFKRIARAYLIGDAEVAFARTLEGKIPYTLCGNLRNAVRQAAAQALQERRTGAVVLLSPACASFDQWKSFEERGDAFTNFVANREWERDV